MKSINSYVLYVTISFLFILTGISLYEVNALKDEIKSRPPIFAMDITAIAIEGAKDLKTSEERTAFVKHLEKITHDLSEKGYLVINSGNVLAAPKEAVISLEDIKNMDEN